MFPPLLINGLFTVFKNLEDALGCCLACCFAVKCVLKVIFLQLTTKNTEELDEETDMEVGAALPQKIIKRNGDGFG